MIEITSANMRNYWFGRILVEIEVPDGACSGKDNGKLESESLLHGVAPLGSAAIVDTNLDSIEVDGTFDVLISLTLLFHLGDSFRTNTVHTVLYDNGIERARLRGTGKHSLRLSALEPGFHHLVHAVVNSSWLSSADHIWQCYLGCREAPALSA